MIKSFDVSKLEPRRIQELLLDTVAPRPIAFVSTIDKAGVPNLSPFSFFNAFSSNPPIMIFSPARKGRDGSLKHSYLNVKEVPEVVINMVNHDIVEQMSLSSTEYAADVDEFVKSGLTAIPSETVKPFRVKESPAQFECDVIDVIELGNEGGAGNLVICKVKMIHIDNAVMNLDGRVDPDYIDLVGRMGGPDYIRASGDALFSIPKPISTMGIGIDALPEHIRTSEYLTGNDLARFGGMESLPVGDPNFQPKVQDFLDAKGLLDEGKTEEAYINLIKNKE
jgi:flavin reductase (DIM6/NTAB) family NADH-FMN oxidoreductase RutF